MVPAGHKPGDYKNNKPPKNASSLKKNSSFQYTNSTDNERRELMFLNNKNKKLI